MEKVIEIIDRSLELTNTIEEGLRHMNYLIGELQYEGAFQMFNDVAEAIFSIEKATLPLIAEGPEHGLAELANRLREAISVVLKDYEDKNVNLVPDHMENGLMPAYIQWKAELTRVLNVYKLS